MLVDFRQAVGELVLLVVDGVGEGQLDPLQFGEDAFHLGHDEVLHAVVVVDMEESASDEVGAEVLGFAVAEDHVAVAGHVEEGVVEDFITAHIHRGILWIESHLLVLVAEGDEVGEGGGVGVPVAAAAVFEEGQLGLGMQGASCKVQGEK